VRKPVDDGSSCVCVYVCTEKQGKIFCVLYPISPSLGDGVMELAFSASVWSVLFKKECLTQARIGCVIFFFFKINTQKRIKIMHCSKPLY
jgi:hypothetical protein